MRLPFFSALLCLAFLAFVPSLDCVAQSNAIPRVGTIKDYPATGLMTGCANLYFYPVPRTDSSGDAYIFIARGDGSNAWMNLNGRDVRLQQVKSKPRVYNYRVGALRISVAVEDLKTEQMPATEADFTSRMKITLRQGNKIRVVRAVGGSDC